MNRTTNKATWLGLVLLATLVLVGVAYATLGDHVGSVTFSVDCESGIGVGIAYDGTNLWYSCHEYRTTQSKIDLHRADPNTGVVTASYDIVPDGGLGALSYDATRNVIWAGEGGEGPGGGPIYRIDLDAGKNVIGAVLAFSTGDYCSLDDGLAFDARNVGDPNDDVFYYSDDCSTRTIDVYSISGGPPIESFPWGGNGCYNSGLAIGGQILYQGSDGCSHVWVVDKTTKAPAFDFSTIIAGDPNFRDEDLECDTNTFAAQGKHVMWSKEAYSPMRAYAFEIEFGSCGVGGVPAEDVEVTKDYRFTNVCFERDDDRDGKFSEDPLDWSDTNGDGLIDEDPIDCPDGTSLGIPLPQDGAENYIVEAVLKRNGTVSSYNPGQYYAVSTVEVLTDLETLWISEHYGDCTEDPKKLSALNPKKGGGSVVIVEVGPDGVARQIADAKSPNVEITDDNTNGVPDNAEVYLENVPADTTILMYVKFGPGLKGLPLPSEELRVCENTNSAQTEEGGPEVSATANLRVKPKNGDTNGVYLVFIPFAIR
jgi:hypothetical protein